MPSAHLACIATRMLDTYAVAGHHQYAKGARLYCQMMKEFETDPTYTNAIKNITEDGNHVVRYSDHEWSGTWCDMCIEQKLMKAAKSEGGLIGGRMRNSESGHRCWLQTLNHLYDINLLMENNGEQSEDMHKDLTKSRMEKDAQAIASIRTWLENKDPFDEDRDKNVLVAFSTGFYSTSGVDKVNAEKSSEVGKAIYKSLNNKTYGTPMEAKSKVQALSSLRNTPVLNGLKVHT